MQNTPLDLTNVEYYRKYSKCFECKKDKTEENCCACEHYLCSIAIDVLADEVKRYVSETKEIGKSCKSCDFLKTADTQGLVIYYCSLFKNTLEGYSVNECNEKFCNISKVTFENGEKRV